MVSTRRIFSLAGSIFLLLVPFFVQSASVGQAQETKEIKHLNEDETSPKLKRLIRQVGHSVVAGGRDPKPHTFGHVVALGRNDENNDFVYLCGGTLMSSSWILTAAHCTHGIGGGIKIARLGIRRLDDKNGVTISISRTCRHPSYRPPALYADIALLKLQRPVTFNENIQPSCLGERSIYPEVYPFVLVSGWGATEFGGSESNDIQEAELQVLDNEFCAAKHNSSVAVPNGIQPSMICAGAPNNGWQQDTCQGDSGGPLVATHTVYPCPNEIIGITSFGAVCAFPDSPGVYTKVSHYRDWIERIVWPERN